MLTNPNSVPYESVLFFTINNRGSGTLVNSQIGTYQENGDGSFHGMRIIFPTGLDLSRDAQGNYDTLKFSSGIFKCESIGDGSTVCKNTEAAIPLYKDQSRTSLRFTVRVKDPLTEPFRSYQITSNVGYSYELRNKVDMTINTFQNV